jgi:vancomycin resistance protein YoaR
MTQDAQALSPATSDPMAGSIEPIGLLETPTTEASASVDVPLAETPPATLKRRRVSVPARFAIAFLAGAVAVGMLGTGAIYAYEQQHVGRVLPGVRIGTVDLSGLDRATAIERLQSAYGGLADGKVVVTASVARVTIPYSAFGRRADVEAMADAALAVGRSGSPVDRALAEVRTAVRGVELTPWITYDASAFASIVSHRLGGLALEPVDATIAMTDTGIQTQAARWGRVFDPVAVSAAAVDRLDDLDAPAELSVQAKLLAIRPELDDTDAELARSVATRMIGDVAVILGEENWAVAGGEIRKAIGFEATADGRYQPVVDRAVLEAALVPMAKEAHRAPVNATFLIGRNGDVVGVTAGRNGRNFDVKATAERIETALMSRAAGKETAKVEPAMVVTSPNVTTQEAEKVAPLMTRISTWTTWFPIGEKNYWGANIWIPSSIINGYVVGPGETFDFWKAVGPVSRARGYGAGGAIINGRTQPTGALAGGICSCSTTLFNAALRAGLKMGERSPHYYYIDRYPLGLDATVSKTSGYVQNMTFVNDTNSPILIRGINTRSGGKGYVRFDLYSVPTGRSVSFSKPVVRDVLPATTRVQYTSSMAPGARKQIEFPVAGRKTWVTRTVRDGQGRVIHQEVWFSHYKRVDGIILVGTGGSTQSTSAPAAPPAQPTPAPQPPPAPAPSPSP